MKTRVMVCLTLVISIFALGLLPVAAQEDACYSKYGNWFADTQKCTVSFGVRVDVDYPLEMAQYPEVAKVIDAFIADQQKSFISSYTPDYSLPTYTNNWSMNISNEIGNCHNLNNLSLINNQLHNLPDAFYSLNQLEDCSLIGNPISTLPYSLVHAPKLTFLDLEHTLIPQHPILRSQEEIRNFIAANSAIIKADRF